MIWHFLNKISKLEIKHLKVPGNQKAFKGVPKENKNYTKRFCKKNQNQCTISCTIYKTLFETLKKKSKKSYHVNLNDKYKHYVKKTKDVIREIIGKSKFKIKKLPPRILIDKKKKRLFKTL